LGLYTMSVNGLQMFNGSAVSTMAVIIGGIRQNVPVKGARDAPQR